MPNIHPEDIVKTKDNIVDFSKPIMVSCESSIPIKDNIDVVSDDGRIWDIDLMYFDEISRNNNVYPGPDVKRSFAESVWVTENLKKRSFYGELEHPPADASMERFMFVEPTRYAWIVLDMRDCGDHYRGHVGLCAPLGTSIVMPNFRDFGGNYGASCRISTPNFIEKMQGGRKVYVKKYKMYPIAIDCIDELTGLPKCTLFKDGEYQPDPIDYKRGVPGGYREGSVESSGAKIDMENSNQIRKSSGNLYNVLFTNPAEQLKGALASSESGRIISDIYGFDIGKANAILTKDLKVKFKTGGGSISVPINNWVLNALKR